MTGCSAINCRNSTVKGFKLHRFPSESTRRSKWLINMRRGKWEPTSASRLCEIHFEECQYESHRKDGLKKLKPNAVPTLFDVPNSPRMINRPPRHSIYINSMSRTYVCCVPGCYHRLGDPGIRFFLVPIVERRREQWQKFIGGGVRVSHHTRVCSAHFTPADYHGTGRLKRVAFPTLKRPMRPVPSKIFQDPYCSSSPPVISTSDPQIPCSTPEISNLPSSVRSSFSSGNGLVDLISNHDNVAEECTFEEGLWKHEIKEESLLEEEIWSHEDVECEPFAFIEVTPKEEDTAKGFLGCADEDPLAS